MPDAFPPTGTTPTVPAQPHPTIGLDALKYRPAQRPRGPVDRSIADGSPAHVSTWGHASSSRVGGLAAR
ncbi:MAG: hypothetical protein QOF35_1984 [Actinomycetota bacterium]|jgi:hypothetical protein|nr:hypothetical protein [Actinomycetota bacterium]